MLKAEKHGDCNAFDKIMELYDSYYDSFILFAVKILQDPFLAEDVVQTVFLKAIQKIDLFQNVAPEKYKTYLAAMVKNQSYSEIRRQKRHQQVFLPELEEYVPDSSDGIVTLLERLYDYDELYKHLTCLHPSYQKIIQMRYFMKWDDKKIAAFLKTTESNVRVLTHRAIKSLRKSYLLNKK